MIGLLKDIAPHRPRGKALLGLDVGAKTIGLALCDPDLRVATPLQTIKRVKLSEDVKTLQAIIKEYEIGGFVIGLPVGMDGQEGRRAQSVRDFAAEFARRLPMSDPWIALWDERLSPAFVEDLVDKSVEKRKIRVNAKASGLIDKLAAQQILQGAIEFMQNN